MATVFLISRAEEMEQGDPAYLAELQRWLRTDPAAVDGVPVEAVPSGDPHARPSNWLIRDFVAGEREQHPFLADGDPDAPPPEVERPTVVLMGTEDDDRHAWLQAGRALGRLLLHATAAGAGGLAADPGAGLAGDPDPHADPAVPRRSPPDAAPHGVPAGVARPLR